MNRITQKIVILVALALGLLASVRVPVESRPIQVRNGFNASTARGRSGGPSKTKDCGFIASKPNQVIDVATRINYMRVSVRADGGQPTLLIKGPNGRFCVIADQVSNINPKISGVWLPGRYEIYVGDRSGESHSFDLTISK